MTRACSSAARVTSVGDLPTSSVSAVQLILEKGCSEQTPPLVIAPPITIHYSILPPPPRCDISYSDISNHREAESGGGSTPKRPNNTKMGYETHKSTTTRFIYTPGRGETCESGSGELAATEAGVR